MALFGSKKTENKAKPVRAKKPAKAPAVSVPAIVGTNIGAAAVSIIRPHITEKSGLLSQGGVYTFQVARNANKNMVSQAVAALYKVKPMRVAIINSPAKRVIVRGKRGMVAGMRKAMVTLKKGDKIDFV